MPVSALYSCFLLFLRVTHALADAMVDTGSVSDDDRGSVVSFCLADCLEGLSVVGSHCNLCAVYVTVGGCDESEVFLAYALAGSGKLGDSADRSSLGCLAAGVGVNLSVDYENVDVFA